MYACIIFRKNVIKFNVGKTITQHWVTDWFMQ